MKKILLLLVAVLMMSCSNKHATLDERVTALQDLYPESMIYMGSGNTNTPTMIVDTSGIEDLYFVVHYEWVYDVVPRKITRLREIK